MRDYRKLFFLGLFLIGFFLVNSISGVYDSYEPIPVNYKTTDAPVESNYIDPITPLNGNILDYNSSSSSFNFSYTIRTQKIVDETNATNITVRHMFGPQNEGNVSDNGTVLISEELAIANGVAGLKPGADTPAARWNSETGTHEVLISANISNVKGESDLIKGEGGWEDGHFSFWIDPIYKDSKNKEYHLPSESIQEVKFQIRESGDYVSGFFFQLVEYSSALYLMFVLLVVLVMIRSKVSAVLHRILRFILMGFKAGKGAFSSFILMGFKAGKGAFDSLDYRSTFVKKIIVGVLLLLCIALLVNGLTGQSSFIDIFNQELENDDDIVLITVDSLRKDYIDCEDSFEDTPNICGLRNDSASFSNSYSHASYTTPAMSGVMTGRHPWKIDMLDEGASELPENVSTLAEVLEKRGYRNYASWEIAGVSPDYGFNRGFYRYIQNDLLDQEISKGEADLWLIDAARYDEKPSFVYYHLFGPHQPFRTDESCKDFSRRMKETSWEEIYDIKPKYRDKFSSGKAKECYSEAVQLSDRRVGNIIERLKENNRYKDSLIIFTADHGEGLWDNRIFGHSMTVYEEQINIPLYIKLPEAASEVQRVDEIDGGYARHVDIYPTVLDYLGIKDDFSDRPGESLLPAIKGDKPLNSDSVKATSVNSRSMIIDGFKMIEAVNEDAFHVESRYEYFENVTGNKSEIKREDIPQRYIDRFDSGIQKIEIKSGGSQRERHDEELIRRLEELGYVS